MCDIFLGGTARTGLFTYEPEKNDGGGIERKKYRPSSLRGLLGTIAGALALCCASVGASASDETLTYDIPPSPLKDALNAVAQKSDRSVLFPFNDVNALNTDGLRGEYTLEEALSALLEGTDLQARITEEGVVTIVSSRRSSQMEQEMPVKEKSRFAALLSGVSAITMSMVALSSAPAQDAPDEADVDEIVVLGSRSTKARSATDSPVPVDVLSASQFNALGNAADLTDNLKMLVPSYTATPATGDGSAFIRPTSLRGMAPDQTLVLVNGKRRHRSSLIQFFALAAGNGAHGVDVGMIPGVSLERVEVLRDGAASQYGSDAIAGVINFVTRDDSSGFEGIAQYGQFYQGEQSYKLAGNIGLPLGPNGFINVSGEYVDNEALSRGVQRPDAQALIDAGVQGVGADAPFGDTPLVQTWGRPETSGARFFVNSGLELSPNAELYLHGNYADTDGRYRFFYRNPSHPTIAALQEIDPNFSLPAGYTPFLDGDQTDVSVVGGVAGEFGPGVSYDASVGFGQNELDYFLNNTLNQSLGLINGQPPQRDFDVGALEQEEITGNIDFSVPLSADVNLAFGAEAREETYTITPGEPNSYEGAGSNGFGGFRPEDSGSFSRSNWALYGDVEYDVTDELLMQFALRYEDYTDVGGTLNWKVAGRYNVLDNLAVRGSASTGFHAPTPGQANVRATITTFDGTTGLQVEEGLVPPTSPQALAVGGAPLKEEESLNFSLGFTSGLTANTTLTADVYRIEVEDRIYRTGDIPVPGSTTGATISFYTNALDILSQGVDVVLTSNKDWGDSSLSTDFSLAMNYGKLEVTGQTPVGDINPVSDALIEDIENNYPELRFVATANTNIGERWNLMTRANYYGSHYDERGTIGAATDPSAEIDPIVYFDVELGFQVNDNFRIDLGGANIFDSFVDEVGAPNANRLSVGLQYPRRTVANYEGGSWYLRGTIKY